MRQAAYRTRVLYIAAKLAAATPVAAPRRQAIAGHANCSHAFPSRQPQKRGADMSQASDAREVVLYVEDHPVNVLLMQTVFELRPELDLRIAIDGASAMAMAPALKPSLLLLDLRLPDCHGTELLERMRKLPGWEKVPAIAVTAEAEFMPAGTTFSDVWHKPLRVPTLLTRLDRVLAPPAPGAQEGGPAPGTAARTRAGSAGTHGMAFAF
jgi:CheY-like chemotaxis protein